MALSKDPQKMSIKERDNKFICSITNLETGEKIEWDYTINKNEPYIINKNEPYTIRSNNNNKESD